MNLVRSFIFALALTPLAISPACPTFAGISFSPSSLTFAPRVVNPTGTASAAQTITVMSTGRRTLSITSIVSSGGYSETNDCPASLPTNATCKIQVTVAPNALGSINGTITVTSNVLGLPRVVNLSGAGAAPLGFSAGSLDFGSVTIGTISTAQSVTLTNQQSASLTIKGISTSGDYSAHSHNCPVSLGSEQTCQVDVAFAPTVTGSIAGALTVVTDGVLATQSISLTGSGSGTAKSQVSLSPTALDFGNQEAGTTGSKKTITLTNTSSALSLTVTSVAASSANYSETDTCVGTPIPAGGTCTITVNFQPSVDFVPLTYAGAITVLDSDATAPHVVGLSGTGVAPVSASPLSLDFGTINADSTSDPKTITIINYDSNSEDVSLSTT
jgi:hypothetical protein